MPVEPLLGPLINLPGTEVATPLLISKRATAVPRSRRSDGTCRRRYRCESSCPSRAGSDSCAITSRISPTRLRPVRPRTSRTGPWPLAGPAVQVVTHDALLLPQPPRHARPEMTTEKIQALTPVTQVDTFVLSGCSRNPNDARILPRQGVPGLCRTAAQHHTVIGVAHQLPHPAGGQLGVEHVQVDVGQQWRDDSSNAVGNFCFEVSLSYRRVELPRRVSAAV